MKITFRDLGIFFFGFFVCGLFVFWTIILIAPTIIEEATENFFKSHILEADEYHRMYESDNQKKNYLSAYEALENSFSHYLISGTLSFEMATQLVVEMADANRNLAAFYFDSAKYDYRNKNWGKAREYAQLSRVHGEKEGSVIPEGLEELEAKLKKLISL